MESKILEKIQKLFKLSESPNIEEADAALSKAHALLKEYNLSFDDIKEKSDVGSFVVEGGKKETRWKSNLLNNVVKFNYCELVTVKGRYEYSQKMYGYEHNVKASMVMYEYLCEAVERLTFNIRKDRKGINANDLKNGIVVKLSERLRDIRFSESDCTALIPISKKAEEEMMKDCPDIEERSVKVEKSLSTFLGYQAGDEISLNQQLKSEDYAIGRLN